MYICVVFFVVFLRNKREVAIYLEFDDMAELVKVDPSEVPEVREQYRTMQGRYIFDIDRCQPETGL